MASEKETAPPGMILHCGWGRLIFAHTFAEPQEVAHELLAEAPGQRDIAFYVTDPHIILNTAPRNLFMDPSHTYRLKFSDYRETKSQPNGFVIEPVGSRKDFDAINRIYHRQQMVPVDVQKAMESVGDERFTYFVAREKPGGEVLGVALGVDHQLAFRDLENGSSLWSLAVDPQATIPGVGVGLVRHLIRYFQEAGRAQLDLSVLHTNEEAIALYSKLGFERVPVFAIKRCNPINEDLFTGVDLPEGFNPYATIIIKEAARRGIEVEPVHPGKGFFLLRLGGRAISCRESLSDLTSAVAMSRCDDKEMTRFLLDQAGLNFPDQRRAGEDPEADAAFLEKHQRVVVKPARGEQGQGVAVNLKTREGMEEAIQAARQICDNVLLEQFVEGQDLRLIVINYELVAAAVRKPARITGTGKHTIERLIESASRRREAATGGESKIPMDAETLRCIEELGMNWDAVLEEGKTISVRNTANLHTGGTIHDVTPELHPKLGEAAILAAQVLEIPVVGLDFLVPSPKEPDYVVIEANERPGLANHEPQPTAERFIDLLFPATAHQAAMEKPNLP